jgi:hypothetical protein
MSQIVENVHQGKSEYDKVCQLFGPSRRSKLNPIRVWGGGVYEEDIFYDICDELGIFLWNDFMFVCGTYPTDTTFLETISAEVEDNLRRLRHHPQSSHSLATTKTTSLPNYFIPPTTSKIQIQKIGSKQTFPHDTFMKSLFRSCAPNSYPILVSSRIALGWEVLQRPNGGRHTYVEG